MSNFSIKMCLAISVLFGSVGGIFASELPPCPTSGYFHNCFATYTYGPNSQWSGDKYVGELMDGKFHGQGTYTHANGNRYVGEYKDGKRTGQGTYTFANGNKYVGEWRDDKYNGQGTLTFADGEKYFGEFRDNNYNGQGTFTFADGTIQEGIWKDDEFQYAKKLSPPVPVIKAPAQSELPPCPLSGIFHNCFGTYTFNNGDKYVGEWRDDKRNGKGTDTYANGDKYVGESKDDKQNGQGTYTYANGNRYVGEFKDGKRNGQGTYTFARGDRYVGEWRDDKNNGQGTYTFDNGDKYVGEFKDNTYHGQGTFTYANGNRYVGEYKDDKRTGQGTFTWVDGERYVGEFKDGKTNGQGVRTFADSSVYIGEERDGKKHGQGTYTFADGTIEEGIWKDDEFQYTQKLSPPVPVVKAPTQNDEIISASSGSGFAVSSDGYVITNHHVIEGCQKVVVHTKGKELPVTVVTYDPQNDLALLKGDFRPSTVFPLSKSRPELLQDVYVAGFPFGDKFSTSVKVTKGIVSSLTGLGNNFSNIQIDAALQSGNSGGPILDELGNIVGVAVAKLDAKYMFEKFGIIPENTNFGIKSSVVRSVLDSNSVDSPSANTRSISKSQLGQMISNGTYYISCWMTMAQIEKMKTRKVLFTDFE